MIFLLPLLKKYYPYLLYLVAFGSGYFYGHLKGFHKAEIACISSTTKTIEKNLKETSKEQEKVETLETKIKIKRQKEPGNDKRDSCLLSNDPFLVDCLK